MGTSLVRDAINGFDPEKHPFFQIRDLQLFLPEEGGKTVGRIAALNNHHYNNYLNEETAIFNSYAAINSPEVSEALFTATFEWSRARGLTKIIGPRGLISKS